MCVWGRGMPRQHWCNSTTSSDNSSSTSGGPMGRSSKAASFVRGSLCCLPALKADPHLGLLCSLVQELRETRTLTIFTVLAILGLLHGTAVHQCLGVRRVPCIKHHGYSCFLPDPAITSLTLSSLAVGMQVYGMSQNLLETSSGF